MTRLGISLDDSDGVRGAADLVTGHFSFTAALDSLRPVTPEQEARIALSKKHVDLARDWADAGRIDMGLCLLYLTSLVHSTDKTKVAGLTLKVLAHHD